MTTSLTRKKSDNPLILNAANAYLRKRLHSQVTPLNKKNKLTDSEFSRPKLLHFNRQKDEENRLLSEVKKLIHNNINPSDILIVATSISIKKSLVILIENTLGVPCEYLNNANPHRNTRHIAICTISFIQSHMLTAPYLFITGLNLLSASESQFHNEPEKEQALIIKNTRQLAIAMTRAQKDLTLLITSDDIPAAFNSPHFHIPTNDAKSSAEVRYLHE